MSSTGTERPAQPIPNRAPSSAGLHGAAAKTSNQHERSTAQEDERWQRATHETKEPRPPDGTTSAHTLKPPRARHHCEKARVPSRLTTSADTHDKPHDRRSAPNDSAEKRDAESQRRDDRRQTRRQRAAGRRAAKHRNRNTASTAKADESDQPDDEANAYAPRVRPASAERSCSARRVWTNTDKSCNAQRITSERSEGDDGASDRMSARASGETRPRDSTTNGTRLTDGRASQPASQPVVTHCDSGFWSAFGMHLGCI